jgi:hypothetical protein
MFPFQETEPPRSFTFAELDDTASIGKPVSLNVLVDASKFKAEEAPKADADLYWISPLFVPAIASVEPVAAAQ